MSDEILESGVESITSSVPTNRVGNQQTARRAVQLLIESKPEFVLPNRLQRKAIVLGFAHKGLVIYDKAFDVVKVETSVDLNDVSSIQRHIKSITICEIKSTDSRDVAANFHKYFSSLSTAELLVAQNLGERYKFVFVNVSTSEISELTLSEVFARAKGIYPSWSVKF